MLPSVLEQTLTLEDYYHLVACVAVEPLPSAKIDIAQAYIRRDLKCVMSGKMPDDLEMSWNKTGRINLEDLPIEEQAKKAIERIVNLRLPQESQERAIKKINEKLERMQKERDK